MDLSKLSDSDLLALKSNDYSKLSNEGLMTLKQTQQAPEEPGLARNAVNSFGSLVSGATDATVGRLGFNNKSQSEQQAGEEHPGAYNVGYALPGLAATAAVGDGLLAVGGKAIGGIGSLLTKIPGKVGNVARGVSKAAQWLGKGGSEVGSAEEGIATLPSKTGARNGLQGADIKVTPSNPLGSLEKLIKGNTKISEFNKPALETTKVELGEIPAFKPRPVNPEVEAMLQPKTPPAVEPSVQLEPVPGFKPRQVNPEAEAMLQSKSIAPEVPIQVEPVQPFTPRPDYRIPEPASHAQFMPKSSEAPASLGEALSAPKSVAPNSAGSMSSYKGDPGTLSIGDLMTPEAQKAMPGLVDMLTRVKVK